MSNEKIRKFPWFYTILLSLLVIGIIVVAIALSQLRRWLEDYESSLPKYAAEKIFNEYFANPDIEAFIKEKDYSVSPAEDFEDLLKYVTDQVGTGEITYNETVGSVDGESFKYAVSAGDRRFAQFTVVNSGERTELGNPIYVLGEYEFFYVIEETHSVKVVAPSDATVTVNGFALDEGYVTKVEETESCAHMPSKIFHNDDTAQGIKYSTYVIDGLLYPTDDVKVTDKYGDECKVEQKEDGSFSATVNYNKSIESQYSERALTFAKGYAKYAQGCGKFAEFRDVMDSNSSIYVKVQTLQNQFVHTHDSCEFTDEKTSEFYEYAPGVFSCRVSFTWHAHRENAPEAYEYIDMTLYFHEVEGEYVLYDMLTHSDFAE